MFGTFFLKINKTLLNQEFGEKKKDTKIKILSNQDNFQKKRSQTTKLEDNTN